MAEMCRSSGLSWTARHWVTMLTHHSMHAWNSTLPGKTLTPFPVREHAAHNDTTADVSTHVDGQRCAGLCWSLQARIDT